MTGRRCGRLTVKHEAGRDGSQSVKWLCACDCGAEIVVRGSSLRNGKSTTCGCSTRTHGMTNAPEYKVWEAMRRRCLKISDPSYERYGGRGIEVCVAWLSFESFYADMGHRPDGGTLERIDNDRGYSSENCRWATRLEQSNNRRSNRWLTVNGERKTITEWSRGLGASDGTVAARVKRGWRVEDAVMLPVNSVRSYDR